MAHRVGIVGASGYGGAELIRLIGGHPALEVAVVAAGRSAGQAVDELHPNLPAGMVMVDPDVDILAELDLVFLATPHAVALELGGPLYDAGTPVVDLSAAYRLPPRDFLAWYGEEHPHPQATPATYGLVEWNREAVAGSRFVANPGCYPTATLLGLLPLAGLVEPGTIVVDAKSGTSGAGRGLRQHLHHPEMHGDLAAYGAPTHRHTGEIETWLTRFADVESGPISFTPHLVPMVRGLLATCYASLRDGVEEGDVADAIERAYADEPFVRTLAAGRFPRTKAVHGSNGCQIAAVVDPRTRRVVVTSVIDNLGKGAAGQALQNANLVLGLDEMLGLTAVGLHP